MGVECPSDTAPTFALNLFPRYRWEDCEIALGQWNAFAGRHQNVGIEVFCVFERLIDLTDFLVA